jgi:hypothetical protein
MSCWCHGDGSACLSLVLMHMTCQHINHMLCLQAPACMTLTGSHATTRVPATNPRSPIFDLLVWLRNYNIIDPLHRVCRFLNSTFGFAPKVAWQIDPFGHSATQAALLSAAAGYEALFFGRADYQVTHVAPDALLCTCGAICNHTCRQDNPSP